MADEVITVGTTEAEQAPDVNALKAEIERLTVENGKLKNAQSNASADASKFKKQLQERMSAQEKAEAETKDLIETLRAENESMKKEREIAVSTAAFVGVGFNETLAKQAAEAFGGNREDFIVALKSFITEHDKALNADALRATPRPGAGAVEPAVTKEQFEKMTYSERVKLYEEQPELYQKLNE